MVLRKKTYKDEPKAIAIDFFCGAGGVTRGFIDAGIMVLAGIDNDPNCKNTYSHPKNNFNPWIDSPPEYIEKNIKTGQRTISTKLSIIIDRARNKFANIPVIFSICAPCQPFTRLTKIPLAQKTAERRKTDSNLLEAVLPYIRKFKPDAIFSENVIGIRKKTKYGNSYKLFISFLERNYNIGSSRVNAKYFGTPQNRLRNVFIAVRRRRGHKKLELNVPLKDPNQEDFLKVRDVLGSGNKPRFPRIRAGETDPFDLNHRASRLSDLNIERIKLAEPGKPNSILGKMRVDSHKKCDKNNNPNHHCDVYGRMNPDEVAPTITTKCYSFSNGRYGYPYKNQNRAISLREAAVLQSFPDRYTFFPEDAIVQIGKQVGNAVPPKLAEFFGTYLLKLTKSNGRD